MGKGTSDRSDGFGHEQDTPQYDNSQQTLMSSTSSIGATLSLLSQESNLNISAGQPQIKACLTRHTQTNQQQLPQPRFSFHGPQGNVEFNEFKSIMLTVPSSVTKLGT